MIKCTVLDKEFATKEEMFKALKENKTEILSLKKSQVYKSCDKGNEVSSSFNYNVTKEIKGLAKGFIYPVISNTGYIDSHMDAHMPNSMNRTVKQQQGKVHYIINHDLSIGKIIAYPKDVEMLIKDISWKDLGKNYEGNTQALLFKTNTFDYSNKDAVNAIDNKQPVQGSIRMSYKDIKMAINSNEDEFKEEKVEYDKNIDLIVNREVAEKEGYFFPVYEVAIEKEGSMVVLGSNDATEIIYNGSSSKDTQNDGSSKEDTHFNLSDAIKQININL
jgi:hypothetical protein